MALVPVVETGVDCTGLVSAAHYYYCGTSR